MTNIQQTQLAKMKLAENFLISPLYHPLFAQTTEKYEKHLKNSEPILSDVLTPYEAFKEGFERAIASFIKLGQEGQVKKKIVSEAQTKNLETELLENLIKGLLKDFDSVKFIKKDQRYLALYQGKIYQFSTLLERVNFNQISLSEEDLQAYHKLLDEGALYNKPYLSIRGGRPLEEDFDQLDPGELCRHLSFAEKEAINIYTGNFYRTMNALMRGDIDGAIESNYFLPDVFTVKAKANQTIKEALLHIAVAVSGLNKLPDYVPPPGPDGKPQKYLYRGERDLPESVLAKRKWAVLQGGEITNEMGFLSTAYGKPADAFFNEFTEVGVMIKSLKGKKITPLSQFGNSEREILLPPTQMQWLYQKDIITDIYKRQMTLFIAKPVSVPIPSAGISVDDFIQTINPEENVFFGIDTAIA
ncbi:hypothetical protein [Candidatus Protochlamydia phocaeensis]|uniref:hypothetical protein n=1 Tax=Candidatus Protochlamydia phocaeensis TaxID=1414722 RepID=UPI0008392521|nr:hypothetical protein [Candidatus Protochlamydia phocaeensis]